MRILVLFFSALALLGSTYIRHDEIYLKSTYSSVQKDGFPKDLGEEGSIRSHHEPFLWKLLSDKKFRGTWPTAIFLLSQIGGQKSFDRLCEWLVARTKNNELSMREVPMVGQTFVEFSNKGIHDATEVLFAGVRPDFWKLVFKKLIQADFEGEELAENLSGQCIYALAFSTLPRAITLLRSLAQEEGYIHQRSAQLEVERLDREKALKEKGEK